MTDLGHVWLVGSGPGDPGWITDIGGKILRDADVVVFDRLAPKELLTFVPDSAIVIDAGKSPNQQKLSQDEIHETLISYGRLGKKVVRLKGGDPYVFGRGGEEAKILAEAGIPCTVVPGITSAIAGLSAAGIPVTYRGVAVSFSVVTGHEDPTKPSEQANWRKLATATDTLVVLMGVDRIDLIAEQLIAGGRNPQSPSALVQQAATPDQRVVTAPLSEIAQAAVDHAIRSPALFVIGDVVNLRSELNPSRLAPLAGKRVLVTRSRQQASIFVESLRAEGAFPIVLPTIETERRVDDQQLSATVENLLAGKYEWIAFSSAVAVRAFFELLIEQNIDVRQLGDIQIGAVGKATSEELRSYMLFPDIVPENSTGEDLAHAILTQCVGSEKSILLPRAENADPALFNVLNEKGMHVDELTLYLSVPPAIPSGEMLKVIRSGGLDIATFTSSSTVKNLVRILGDDRKCLDDVLIACIGPTTASTARDLGLEPDIVAKEHSINGLLQALRIYHWSNSAV